MTYSLYRHQDGYEGRGWGEPSGEFPSLAEAMAAAGHTDPAHWYSSAGMPDQIFVDWVLYYDKTRDYEGTEYLILPWTIEAPGVAGELTELVTADVTAEGA